MSSMKRRFQVSIVALLFLCAGCGGAPSGKDPMSRYSASQLQEIGEKFLAGGDTAQALQALVAADQKKPNDPVIQYYLGIAYNARGLRNDAAVYFKKALTLKPDYPEANNALGALYAEQGQIEPARECFQKALANPFYSTPHFAHYNLGLLYEKQGDNAAALAQYQDAVRILPSYGHAYFRLGKMLEAANRSDEARRAYGKATEYSPNLTEAHLRYGVMCFLAGDQEPAARSLNRVVKLEPHSVMAEEAKKYLERIQKTPRSGLTHPDPRLAPEAMSNVETTGKPEVNRITPPPPPVSKSAPVRMTGSVKAPETPSSARESTLVTPSTSSITLLPTPTPAYGATSPAGQTPAAPEASPPEAPKEPAPEPVKASATEPPKTAPPEPPKPPVPPLPRETVSEPPKTPAPEPPRTSTPEPPKDSAPGSMKTAASEPRKHPMPPLPEEKVSEPSKTPSPEPPKASTPEPPKASTPEPPKASTPEPPKASTPEPPKDPAPEPPKDPAPEPPKVSTPEPGPAPSPATVSAPTDTTDEPSKTESPPPQINYIVQVGSFADKAQAEEARGKLQAKGYSAVVKRVKLKAQGMVYVIQLKPVNSVSKASTLMTQIEGEVEGKPVIIKSPAPM